MNQRRFRLWLILSIAWLCVIFGHSLMPASLSDGESRGIFAWLHQFFPWLTHHLLRKLAHFSAFAVLGGLLTATFLQTARFSLFKPVGCALAAALMDETIQLFVEGRSGQVSDIWIDLSGALCAALLVWLIKGRRK